MPNTEPVGIIGAGSFGTAMANLLALNTDVLVYSRNKDLVEKLQKDRFRFGVKLHDRVTVLNDFEAIADRCQLILPIVPSNAFRAMMRAVTQYLQPSHVLMHGTKGFDITGVTLEEIPKIGLQRKQVHTMTEVILQESVVVRVGALAGPNLARELLDGQPSASVIASKFDEVTRRRVGWGTEKRNCPWLRDPERSRTGQKRTGHDDYPWPARDDPLWQSPGQ